MKSVQNPHETRIWPNSRARIWPNLAYTNVRFAVAKATFKKNGVFTSTLPGPPACLYLYIQLHIYIYTYIYIIIYIYTYIHIYRYDNI